MAEKLIGVAVDGDTTDQALARILRSEAAGIPAVWMTTGGASLDSITVMAAAAGRTKTVKFGTSHRTHIPPPSPGDGPTGPGGRPVGPRPLPAGHRPQPPPQHARHGHFHEGPVGALERVPADT